MPNLPEDPTGSYEVLRNILQHMFIRPKENSALDWQIFECSFVWRRF